MGPRGTICRYMQFQRLVGAGFTGAFAANRLLPTITMTGVRRIVASTETDVRGAYSIELPAALVRDGYHATPNVDGYVDYAFLPLYPMLRVEGWRYRVEPRDGGVELTLERRKPAVTTVEKE